MATPLMAAAAVVNPVVAARTVITGLLAQKGTQAALDKAGVPEEYARLAGDAAGVAAAGWTVKDLVTAGKKAMEPFQPGARFGKPLEGEIVPAEGAPAEAQSPAQVRGGQTIDVQPGGAGPGGSRFDPDAFMAGREEQQSPGGPETPAPGGPRFDPDAFMEEREGAPSRAALRRRPSPRRRRWQALKSLACLGRTGAATCPWRPIRSRVSRPTRGTGSSATIRASRRSTWTCTWTKPHGGRSWLSAASHRTT